MLETLAKQSNTVKLTDEVKLSSDVTGHLYKRPNNGKDGLGLKFCEILVSLRPMDLVFLIFT